MLLTGNIPGIQIESSTTKFGTTRHEITINQPSQRESLSPNGNVHLDKLVVIQGVGITVVTFGTTQRCLGSQAVYVKTQLGFVNGAVAPIISFVQQLPQTNFDYLDPSSNQVSQAIKNTDELLTHLENLPTNREEK